MQDIKQIAELKEQIKKLKAANKKLSERLDVVERSQSEDLISGQGDFLDAANAAEKRINAIDDAMKSLSQMGATFALGGPLQEGLSQTAFTLDKILANPKAGIEGFKQLTSAIEQFGLIAKAQIGDQGRLNSELGTQATLLNSLGLRYGDFAKNVDMAIFSFGQSADGVKKINLELKNFADSVNLLPGIVSRNFQAVAKNLAYDFNTIKQQFVGIQKLATQTGVSVDRLMGKFGQPMDTIQGASDAAARLNMMLGQNVFSATEILMMDEKTRMERIRDALMGSNAGRLALSGQGPQSKFALQAIANDVLGMSIDDTRRFLSTGDTDSVKRQMTERGVRPAFDQGQTELTNSNIELKDSIDELAKQIAQQQMTPLSRSVLASRRRGMEDATRGDATQIIARMGGLMIREKGFLGGADALQTTMAMVAAEDAGLESQFQKALQFLQMDMISLERFNAIAAGLSSSDPTLREAAKQDVNLLVQEDPLLMDGLTPYELSVLRMLEPGPVKRFMIRKFRKDDFSTGFGAGKKGAGDPTSKSAQKEAESRFNKKEKGSFRDSGMTRAEALKQQAIDDAKTKLNKPTPAELPTNEGGIDPGNPGPRPDSGPVTRRRTTDGNFIVQAKLDEDNSFSMNLGKVKDLISAFQEAGYLG